MVRSWLGLGRGPTVWAGVGRAPIAFELEPDAAPAVPRAPAGGAAVDHGEPPATVPAGGRCGLWTGREAGAEIAHLDSYRLLGDDKLEPHGVVRPRSAVRDAVADELGHKQLDQRQEVGADRAAQHSDGAARLDRSIHAPGEYERERIR